MISYVYDIITNIICKIIYDIMESKLWYHTSQSMISVTYDIIGLWYHRSLISYMITSMTSPMISPMISQSMPTLTQFCKQMISMWVYHIVQSSGAWQRRGVELGSGEERKAADWSLEVLDGMCPMPGPRMATSPRSRWRPGDMSSAPPSSSDGTGAVSFAGVEDPAPPNLKRVNLGQSVLIFFWERKCALRQNWWEQH